MPPTDWWITPGDKEDSRVAFIGGPWPAARPAIQLLSIRNNYAIICALCGLLQGISREVAAVRPAGIQPRRDRRPTLEFRTIRARLTGSARDGIIGS